MKSFLNRIKYFVIILWNPLWYLQRLMPRNNNLWIFGAWFGQKYSDNASVLFEYIDKNDACIEVIWLTKDVEIRNKLRKEGKKAELTSSLKAIFYSLRAGVVCFSSGRKDVNSYFINGAKIINLWHGAPLKKIGLDDEFAKSKLRYFIIRNFYPFLWEYKIDYIINSADIFADKLASAFGLSLDHVICSGFPRNDLLFSDKIDGLIASLNRQYSNPRIILYLPTFRSLNEKFKPFESYNFDEKRWIDFLERNNLVFLSKGHFVDSEVGNNVVASRMIHLSDKDVAELYSLLKDVHILITDFSSVFFDFLLINKPIIFAPFDIDSYVSKSRELYFDYQNIVCGHVANDWNDVIYAVNELLKEDTYAEHRHVMNNVFNKFHDSSNSNRLFHEIKRILN